MHRLGAMFAKCEAGQAWLEHVTYNMSKMSYAEQSEHLAGVIALLKTFLTRCAHEVADDAVQSKYIAIFPFARTSSLIRNVQFSEAEA